VNKILQGQLTDNNFRIGVVTARFNSDVTSLLEQGAVDALAKLGIDPSRIIQVSVPGAFEIPLAAKHLLLNGCDGVIALGAVIRGDTSHYDYVCNSVERGCTQLQLEYGKPVAFGILTTEDEEQAFARAGGKHGNKGAEAADVCIEMIQLARLISKALPNVAGAKN
jgi:6,7-dimethyl-8-ribityllumazine synthase